VTLCFDAESLEGHVSNQDGLNAMQECFAAEARGKTRLPHRIDTSTGHGFLRVMPAVFDDVMGLKVMTLVEGVGNRYMVLLYQCDSGALLAMFDADELTRIRTAATTALAGAQMCATAPAEIGLIGTGFEAVGHLRMLAHLWPLRTVHAYSPNAERRERFAAQMSAELNLDVKAVATSREALAGKACVVLATKAKLAVVDGADFAPGAVVLSIGSTRLDLRELDDRTLARAAVLVVDDPEAVLAESADIADNIKNANLSREHLLPLSALVDGQPLPAISRARDLLVFKSVGTALQDLAMARAVYREPAMRARARDIGNLLTLKGFANKKVTVTA
jgi:ornithine cyclodeaminase/alanine dehydrogenase-like protein (mu-crystallin family)